MREQELMEKREGQERKKVGKKEEKRTKGIFGRKEEVGKCENVEMKVK